MLNARWSLAAAIATMAVWGVNFAFVKYVLDHIGIGAFLFLRFAALPVLAFLLLALVFRSRIGRSRPRRADLPRFVACGLIGHTLHIAVVMYGMNLSTAFSSSLVLTSGPLFTLIILALLGAEHLRLRQVAGTLAGFAGIVLFLSDKFTDGPTRAGAGDLVLLAAALLFAAPPILVFTLPAFLSTPAGVYTAAVWMGLFWAIVVSSLFGWLMWTWVNSVRGVARSAPFTYLMPPIAGFVAWLTLGETFTWLKIAGAAVTMAGVAWAQFGGGPPPKETAQPDTP